MPGQSELWEQELAREIVGRGLVDDSFERSFLNFADVRGVFEFDSRDSRPVSWSCASGFDLPRPNGGNRKFVGRRIGLHGESGSVMFHSVTCHSPFDRAWCRFF